jgi:TPR repeat protein
VNPRQKNLPIWSWVLVFGVFLIVITNIEPITIGLWSTLAPESYADKMLGDEDLANRAGFDPSLVPVLLDRTRKGDRSAMFFYGGLYDPTNFTCETAVPKNAAIAIAWYQRAVALDDQGAERNLAILYHEGVGLTRDDKRAASLFERAVQKNDDLGDYYLGTMLETGQGEPKNLARAFSLEQASAAQGQELGQVELGRMYFFGIGVLQDRAKAAAEWKLAAAQGDSDAQDFLKQNGM